MDLQIRPIEPGELAAYVRTAELAFGHHADEGDVEEARALVEYDRTLAVHDGEVMVATAAALSMELTLPGEALVPAAGVTEVGVLPTHRRRGALRALMAHQLADVAARGEPVAVLTAAEGGIYRRFGYGPAVIAMAGEVGREGSALDAAVETAPGKGSVRLVAPEEAALLLPEVYDRYRRSRPGELSRGEGMWEVVLSDRERWRAGASALFHAVHDEPDGDVSGYALYRVREGWKGAFPSHELEVTEVVATNAAAYARLWRYCLQIDLVSKVSAWNLPVDTPLRWLLADPRQLVSTRLSDVLWVRLVDVEAALAARAYATAGELVIDVEDRFHPPGGGRFKLEAGAGGSRCRRTGEAAHLALGTDALASSYLGGVSFSAQAAAGRVSELLPGALSRADAMFATYPSPSCLTDF